MTRYKNRLAMVIRLCLIKNKGYLYCIEKTIEYKGQILVGIIFVVFVETNQVLMNSA